MARVNPSAGNLVAGMCLMVVAFVVSGMIPSLLPEGTDMGYFTVVNLVLAFIVGWRTIGSRVGRGTTSAITIGLTGSIVLVFWALFVQACNEMTRLAMRNRYGDAFEALIAIFELMTEWFLLMLTAPVLGTLAVGGIISGLVAESAAKRWR
ncbi:MAG: TrgA family protein [Paracoccaceae bacterium]